MIHRSDGLLETFSVLKSDQSVRQGEYKLLLYGSPIQEGFYNNGKKTGIWTFHDNNTNFSYDFDSGTIVSDTLGTARPALYSEGDVYFFYFLYNEVGYPIEAKEAGRQGKVIIEFTVDIDGTPKDFDLKLGCGTLMLNKEAMRAVIKVASAYPWFPAINEKGEKIKSTVERQVNFQLK